MINKIKFFALFFALFANLNGFSQQKGSGLNAGELFTGEVNTITTAVPFLLIAPDSRSGAMGDVGAATEPDVNSMHWNTAKYAFIEKDMAVSLTYTPWLRKLINDINLAYLTAYKKISKKQTVSASLLYFSLGDITFTDDNAQTLGQFSPNEFALDVAYSRLFGNKISGGIAFRYIRSDLTNGQNVTSVGQTHAGNAYAADVSAYYRDDKIKIDGRNAILGIGLVFSNIGSKISYSDNSDKDFIPANMRFGLSLKMDLDNYNTIAIAGDVNKLLVPTPPVYDSTGTRVIAGKTNDVSVSTGIFQSFNDAPGGSQEELNELSYSVGLEYWYAKQFAIRGGYFYEHPTKGNRQYFTLGLGLKMNVFGIDFAYLIPTKQNNPLENTLRFTLSFDLGNKEAKKE